MSAVPGPLGVTGPRRHQFQLTYEISPIYLTGGLATNLAGGLLPIISLLESQAYPTGALSAGVDLDLNNSVRFRVVPGGTLISNQVGTYPFANQTVAANAMIQQGLNVSLMMLAPARGSGGYLAKLQAFNALQQALKKHVTQGGTFTVATPAFLYVNCLLMGLHDASGSESNQEQYRWQWDFYKPLLAVADASEVENTLISKITSGVPLTGDPPTWSGLSNTTGNPASNVAPSVVPAAQPLGGASVGQQTSVPLGGGFTQGFSP